MLVSLRREFDPASIRAKIEASPFVRDKTATPRLLTLTQSTYDGIVYNVEAIKASLDGHVDALHFDEAWLPHAAFHDFYHQMHAIGPGRPRCAGAGGEAESPVTIMLRERRNTKGHTPGRRADP